MITSLLSGGVVGLLGSLLTNLFDIFKTSQKNKQSIELKKMDLELMDKEYQASLQQAAIKADMSKEISSDSLMIESYGHDGRVFSKDFKPSKIGKFLLVMVDVTRAYVRPGLTVYMIYLVTKVQDNAYTIISKAKVDIVNVAEAIELYHEIVSLILFLASASFLWWFGTRGKKKKSDL